MAYDESHDQEIVTFRLPKSVVAIIDKHGKEVDRSRSYLLREILAAWAAEQKKSGKK